MHDYEQLQPADKETGLTRREVFVKGGLLAVGATMLGAPTAAAATRAVTLTSAKVVPVTLNEFNILPAKQAAPAGKVTFILKNTGKMIHEFVVIATPKPAGSLLGGDHGPNRADESGAVGEVGELKPGQTKKLILTLKKGHYALLCNLPGHYKAGQFVDFYVR